ncbi:MAG: ABC transporter permease subunit [Myxococcota bacterium]|jgi:ABC-type transport system involved in multi-copper enzyme maturation permease subunit|nr:ABC transporter permease subunit [Myxococcota bacterium]
MFGRFHAIALNTFRVAVRSNVLYAILFFAVLLILSSMVFGELSLYEQERVIKDLGILIITLFGALVAVYTGVSLLYKEIDKKTIYTIISKPIERWHFLVGKYLGILITMAVEVGIMAILFLLLLVFKQIEITQTLLQALLLIYVETAVVAAIATLFSSFSTPFLSGMMTAALFLLGNLHETMAHFAAKHPEQWVRSILDIAKFLLPDLSLFNLSTEVTYNIAISWGYVAQASAHGGFYIVLMLAAAAAIFRARDFI